FVAAPSEFHFFDITSSANIANLLVCDCKARSNKAHVECVKPGIRFRSDTPPDTRYRNGRNGSIFSTRNSGNFISNCARSLSRTIQGSAPFAPDNGPVDANVHSRASGKNGSGCNFVYTKCDHGVTHGSIIAIFPPSVRHLDASLKKAATSGM